MTSPAPEPIAERDDASAPAPAPGGATPVDVDLPVYVDLDGTLIKSDLLYESLVLLARQQPLALLKLPGWLSHGKPAFKREVAARVRPAVATLPFREEVVAYLEEARAQGRRVVLASASNADLVEEIAAHLGLFDGVMGTADGVNLSGASKLERIRADVAEHADGPDFEYLGNAAIDVPIWKAAAVATAVAPTAAARRGLAELSGRAQTIVPAPSVLRAGIRALRPHQWAKNLLLFAPLLLAHQLNDFGRLASVLLAFAGFCAIASSGYLLNDLFDIEADRQHPSKRRRPLAAGDLPVPAGVGWIVGLLIFAFASSLAFLPPACSAMLLAYLALTYTYSWYFKEQLLLDVLVLAGLYTHRILTGGVAAGVTVSPWLLAFSTFFFLSLALVKRYVELISAREREHAQLKRRAYHVADLGLVESMGVASAFIAVLVLCLFVNSENVATLYRRPRLLWLMCPIMLYWVSRVWFLARRGELHDDPVLFAVTDKVSYVAGAGVAVVVALAAL